MRKLVAKRVAVEEGILQLCQLVDRQDFIDALVELNLLDADVAPRAEPSSNPPRPQPPPHKVNTYHQSTPRQNFTDALVELNLLDAVVASTPHPNHLHTM